MRGAGKAGELRVTTYTTIQGDVWDMIAYKVYGNEKYMTLLLEANPSLVEIAVFPQGVTVSCPDKPPEAVDTLPPWRKRT